MAIRVLYLEDVGRGDRAALNAAIYADAWHRYVDHGAEMHEIVRQHQAGDLDGAAILWNSINQRSVDEAYRAIIGEQEPELRGRSLLLTARLHFGVGTEPPTNAERDRRLRASDSTAAWERAPEGRCNGCSTPTISHAQRSRLHRAFRLNASLFNLHATRPQANGTIVPCWPQVTIAAKGVAEHVVPRSQGGPTDITNLTNVCAACNYSRGDTSMNSAGIANYRRPPAELSEASDR